MKAILNEETHEYVLEDGTKLIGVTKLLEKHKISTDYSKVDKSIIERKAEYGKSIHKDLENYYGYITPYAQLYDISKTAVDLLTDYVVLESETIVNNELIAGKLDLMVMDEQGKTYIIDFKTTFILNRNSVSWQLSLYAKLSNMKIDGVKVVWLNKDKDTFELIDLDMIEETQIEKLIDCERNGVLYKNEILDTGFIMEVQQYFDYYKQQEEILNQLKEQKEFFEDVLKGVMRDNNIKSFDNDYLKISYVESFKKVSYDYKKYIENLGIVLTKEELQSIKKESVVKDSIRIKIKENKK